MKVTFIGFQGDRQHHQDWALEIIPETDFERSFFSALFRSDAFRFVGKIKQMQPIAALLHSEGTGIRVMLSAEDFCTSELVKAQRRIIELEQALKEGKSNV